MTNLDHRCEVWLSKTFGLYLDFAIESTLPTLVEEGLIQEHKSGNEVMQAISAHNLAPAFITAAAAPSGSDQSHTQQVHKSGGQAGQAADATMQRWALQALTG